MAPINVGLVGAGPWADIFHAPMMAAGPETRLAAIWARQQAAAERLAAKHATKAAATFEELLDLCDAVVFSVPPHVQAQYVPAAAAAGKALLLEKPLGLNLDQAEAVAQVVSEAGVVNQIMFTNRYSTPVRQFLTEVAQKKPLGAVATYINGAILPGGLFATPWRVEHGSLLDLGPHVVDIFDAALGPIVDIKGAGDPRRWFAITLRHKCGAVSQASLSLATPVEGEVTGVRVFTEQGEVTMDFVGAFGDPKAPATIRAEFAAAIASGKPHNINVERALYIQRLLDRAARSAGL